MQIHWITLIALHHRRSQGVHWMHVHPQPRAQEKIRGQIYRVKL